MAPPLFTQLRGSALVRALKPRLLPALGVALTIAAGLSARAYLSGFWAKYLGVALWSTCLYAGLLALRPRLSLTRATALCLLLSWLVELAQLTPGPAYLSAQHPLLRLLFGTTFSLADLPAYLLGTLLGAAVHAGLLRRRRRRDMSPGPRAF